MAAYSMDLRQRVARAWDTGMGAESVAATYDVSRAWVHRLIQRRRETGSLAPQRQTKFRGRALAEAEERRLAALITAQPDATLAELREARGPAHCPSKDRQRVRPAETPMRTDPWAMARRRFSRATAGAVRPTNRRRRPRRLRSTAR